MLARGTSSLNLRAGQNESIEGLCDEELGTAKAYAAKYPLSLTSPVFGVPVTLQPAEALALPLLGTGCFRQTKWVRSFVHSAKFWARYVLLDCLMCMSVLRAQRGTWHDVLLRDLALA